MFIKLRNDSYIAGVFSFALMIFLSLMTFAVHSQTENYSFSNVAMGGGGFVSGIITSKSEQNLRYARTDVGGAYRWNASEDKWIPLLDWVSENELGYLGVESIAIDPVESNKVYMLAGTSYFNGGKTAILKSDDYGNTFTIVDVTSQFKAHGNGMGRQTGEKLQVDPNKNSILFCGTRANGLFKSINSGSTWARVTALSVTTTTTENGISFVVLDPSTGTSGNATQTIITGISRTGTNLYRSDDGGTSFSPIAGAPTSLMPHRAVLSKDRKLYVTYVNAAGPWDIYGDGQIGKIWKYDLTGGSWTDVTPAGFSGGFGGISIDPDNVNRLIASSVNTYLLQDNSYGDRIFLSNDGGTSWTDIVGGTGRSFHIDPNGISWIGGNSIHWAGCIEFDPFDTKKAWIISGNGVFSTDDIDATSNVWKFNVKGLEETVPTDLISISNGPLLSSIGDYDGFRHTDVMHYAPIYSPRIGTTTSISYAIQNPDIMLRVGEKDVNGAKSGALYRSSDMGLTWIECVASGAKGNVTISADGSVFFHCPENSNVTYRSTDNGASWNAISGFTVSSARLVADPVNPKKIYAYNNGPLSISKDGGLTFANGGSAGSGGSKIIRLAPDREGDVWVALYNGGLARSVNSGTSFAKVSAVTTCSAIGFGKQAPGKTFPTIFIWGTVNNILGIHRSIDEGSTWKRINDNAHEYGGPANGQFILGDMNVYGRVYMSTAGRGIIYGESDQTCTPTFITPHITINTDASMQTPITSTLAAGSNVLLSPEAANGGSWRWVGQNAFSSSDREVTISSIKNNQAGIYSVRYTNAAGCESAPENFVVNVEEVVAGIREVETGVSVYPNPVRSILVVDHAREISSISITDITGKVLLQLNNDKDLMNIDFSNYPNGIYIMMLGGKDNIPYVKKVIKY